MDNKIQVDLQLVLKDLNLEEVIRLFKEKLNSVGLGTSIEQSLVKDQARTLKLAKDYGLNIGKELALGIREAERRYVTGGGETGKNKLARVAGILGTPLDYADFIKKSLGPRQSISHGYQDNTAAMLAKVSAVSRMGGAPADIQSFINSALGPRQAAAHAGADFWTKVLGPVPPVIGKVPNWAKLPESTPPVIGKNIFARLEQSLGGGKGLLGGFGKYEIGHGFMEAIGMGGGGMGRIGGAALAAFGAKLPGLTVALAVLTPVIDGCTAAFKKLIAAAEEGAKLYQQSRALGTSTLQTSSYLKSLGVVGFDESQAQRLAAYGQFGHGSSGSIRGSVSGQMVASGFRAGMSQLEIQQIMNMSEEIDSAWKRTRMAAIETAGAAKANFDLTTEWRVFKTDFSAFWQQISALASPILQAMIKAADLELQVVNGAVSAMIELGKYLHLISRETTTPKRISGFARDTHFSSLERMGLVIGGHNSEVKGYLSRIANATEKIAQSGPSMGSRIRNAVAGPSTDEALTIAFGNLMGGYGPANIP